MKLRFHAYSLFRVRDAIKVIGKLFFCGEGVTVSYIADTKNNLASLFWVVAETGECV